MKVQRKFLPGSEWLYIKLYTSEALANEIIIKILGQRQIVSLTNEYFFIRYNDPEFHIRFRFHFPNMDNYSQFFINITEYIDMLEKNRYVWKMQFDTYERELERYSLVPIEFTEKHFCDETRFIKDYLFLKQENQELSLDWALSISVINMYLLKVRLSANDKISCMESMARAFKQEFGFNESNSKSLNSMYRNKMKNVNTIIEERTIENTPLVFTSILSDYNAYCTSYFDRLCEKKTDSHFYSHVGSIIHMLNNRIFSTQNRLQELVIYDFLSRYYKSKLARDNKNLVI